MLLKNCPPVTFLALKKTVKHVTAHRTRTALKIIAFFAGKHFALPAVLLSETVIEVRDKRCARAFRQKDERIIVNGATKLVLRRCVKQPEKFMALCIIRFNAPRARVEFPLVRTSKCAKRLAEQTRNRALGRSDRTMEQQETPLLTKTRSACLKFCNKLHLRRLQIVDCVAAVLHRIIEHVISYDIIVVPAEGFRTMRENRMVHALIGGLRNQRVFGSFLEIFIHGALPEKLFGKN